MKAIHMFNGGSANDEIRAGGQGPWSNVLKAMKWWKAKGMHIYDIMYKHVGDDKDTSFWNKNWIFNRRLKDSHLTLFELD